MIFADKPKKYFYENNQVRILSLIVLFISFFNVSYAQKDTSSSDFFSRLQDKGFTFGILESLEGYRNFTGGLRTGYAWASTFDVNVTMDLQKILNLPGGTFYTDLEDHAGENPTARLVGDWQVFDKHNSSPFFQVMEIWYQQILFNQKLRIKVGKIDANAEFSVIDNGLDFINSSTQVTPTFFVFPTFPDPVPAINIFFTPKKFFYTNFALDDANQNAKFLDFYGDPVSVQPTKNGALFLSESGFVWDHDPLLRKDGNLKLGLWRHNGTFPKFDGTFQHGADGFYVIFDQTLWEPAKNESGNRGFRMYLEYTITDSTVSPVYEHIGGGVTWAGLSANRSSDATGISAHYALLSPGLASTEKFEFNLEGFYQYQISPWLNIEPDVQYIVHPGGHYRNVLIGTLLFNFAFQP